MTNPRADAQALADRINSCKTPEVLLERVRGIREELHELGLALDHCEALTDTGKVAIRERLAALREGADSIVSWISVGVTGVTGNYNWFKARVKGAGTVDNDDPDFEVKEDDNHE